MSEKTPHRRPATFRLDDPAVVVMDAEDSTRPARGTVRITPEADPALLPVVVDTPLAAIERLHLRAADVLASDDRAASRTIVDDLLKLAHQNPQLARARATLKDHAEDIIDGADMIKLAERELMTLLDSEARRLVSSAAQRVSVVTAVSPRAMIDVLFVFVAALRLIRQLARLYGGRPGALGMVSLMRHVIAHLAIT